ncbi:hypothetical protein QR680_004536 [Steinernema hermaphroditum]|uniref:Uncharacterized protein n=1 Tax=Steinernema hermaphroditum TaxID=289476 RepID=A0AA39LTU5_9BILA|nr:hypothetical protein QR680_004536 [Steinernema hermaphroditum]
MPVRHVHDLFGRFFLRDFFAFELLSCDGYETSRFRKTFILLSSANMNNNTPRQAAVYSRKEIVMLGGSDIANEPPHRMIQCVLRGLNIATDPEDKYKPCDMLIKRALEEKKPVITYAPPVAVPVEACTPKSPSLPNYLLDFDAKPCGASNEILPRCDLDPRDQEQLNTVEYSDTDELAITRAETLFMYWSLDEANDDHTKRQRAVSNMHHLKEMAKKYNMPCNYMK